MSENLDDLVKSVVVNGNCSGCGGCSLISDRISMQLDTAGFLRPRFSPRQSTLPITDSIECDQFRMSCPGLVVGGPFQKDSAWHPTFGSFISAWSAWAVDEQVRHAGSSGGVLTALNGWLVESGKVKSIRATSGSAAMPSRTVPVEIMSKSDALRAAGSRYAPVSNIEDFDPTGANGFVGKPCEVSALRQKLDYNRSDESSDPILLSFFCAGTPSQHATESLISKLGVDLSSVVDVRYRGDGWPGAFRVRGASGIVKSMSYHESWGKHLGRQLQDRCKVCVDGTGQHADIAVGDYWASDKDGFPKFDDADGISVVIARTERGHQLLLEAVSAGVIEIRSASLDDVAEVQPLQVKRRATLFGRLLGRRLAGRTVPRYPGHRLLRIGFRHPMQSSRALVGTFRRSVVSGRQR
jgi:coenzyme F420 hydrogenase subunit beta